MAATLNVHVSKKLKRWKSSVDFNISKPCVSWYEKHFDSSSAYDMHSLFYSKNVKNPLRQNFLFKTKDYFIETNDHLIETKDHLIETKTPSSIRSSALKLIKIFFKTLDEVN